MAGAAATPATATTTALGTGRRLRSILRFGVSGMWSSCRMAPAPYAPADARSAPRAASSSHSIRTAGDIGYRSRRDRRRIPRTSATARARPAHWPARVLIPPQFDAEAAQLDLVIGAADSPDRRRASGTRSPV